jgi:hypothetical protein
MLATHHAWYPMQAAALVRHLQSAACARRLWAYEDASLTVPQPPSAAALYGMVQAVVRAMGFAENLGVSHPCCCVTLGVRCGNKGYPGDMLLFCCCC